MPMTISIDRVMKDKDLLADKFQNTYYGEKTFPD
jgi:hypothetical protein